MYFFQHQRENFRASPILIVAWIFTVSKEGGKKKKKKIKPEKLNQIVKSNCYYVCLPQEMWQLKYSLSVSKRRSCETPITWGIVELNSKSMKHLQGSHKSSVLSFQPYNSQSYHFSFSFCYFLEFSWLEIMSLWVHWAADHSSSLKCNMAYEGGFISAWDVNCTVELLWR